jgi:predicted  nucleic acid-binding Zn-ribbon protein
MSTEAYGRTAELIRQLEASNANLRTELNLSEDARDTLVFRLDDMIDREARLKRQIADLLATKSMYDSEKAQKYAEWKAQVADISSAKEAAEAEVKLLRAALLEQSCSCEGAIPGEEVRHDD